MLGLGLSFGLGLVHNIFKDLFYSEKSGSYQIWATWHLDKAFEVPSIFFLRTHSKSSALGGFEPWGLLSSNWLTYLWVNSRISNRVHLDQFYSRLSTESIRDFSFESIREAHTGFILTGPIRNVPRPCWARAFECLFWGSHWALWALFETSLWVRTLEYFLSFVTINFWTLFY